MSDCFADSVVDFSFRFGGSGCCASQRIREDPLRADSEIQIAYSEADFECDAYCDSYGHPGSNRYDYPNSRSHAHSYSGSDAHLHASSLFEHRVATGRKHRQWNRYRNFHDRHLRRQLVRESLRGRKSHIGLCYRKGRVQFDDSFERRTYR